MTTERASIDGFDAIATQVAIGAEDLVLWQVADLERHVDRDALLAGEAPPEPPYWAHLWSGAAVLAAQVPAGAGRVIEVGCGLGLPGLAAARRGAEVMCVDRAHTPLRFVAASAAANALSRVAPVCADFLRPPFATGFDLVLAAEVLYDRAAFGAIARSLRALVAPGGRVLLADGLRIDTSAFYDALGPAGFAWRVEEHATIEEGFSHRVKLAVLTPLR